MEYYEEDDSMETQPETPVITNETEVSSEDKNEYLLGDDDSPDDVTPKGFKEEEEE